MAKYGLTAGLGQYTDKGTLITEKIQQQAQAINDEVLEITEDNREKVKNAMNQAFAAALEEIGLAAERFAKKQTPVDTGRLRNSITHVIDPEEEAVYVGTNVEYAPYLEYDVHVGGKLRKGHHMLRNAATEHSAYYQRIIQKHMDTVN